MTILTHQKTVQASYLLAAVTLISMPDMVAGLVMEILHLLVEFLHIAFEFTEVLLDHLVEHLFHTEVHETQVIVFYTLITMGAIAGYFIWRGLRHAWYRLKLAATESFLLNKTEAYAFWHEQPAIEKIKLISVGSTLLTCIVLFGF